MSISLFDWSGRCGKKCDTVVPAMSSEHITTRPPQGGLWFLESLFHPGVPSALPDGQNSNFVLKPIRSSINFSVPGDIGDATMVLYPANPLGRVAEIWRKDPDDDTGYGEPSLFDSAQPLFNDYDYARYVKGVISIESSSLPAGAYVLNGRAVCVKFPYPAGEKPSTDGTSTASKKYDYEALVGVQSDPTSIVTGVKMNEGIVVLTHGQMGEKPLRLGDNVASSNANTKVTANDARQSLHYMVNAEVSDNATFSLSQTPHYFRAGRVLCTGVGGVIGDVTFRGKFVPEDAGPIALKVGYFLEAYDLMGRVIGTEQVVANNLWNGAELTEINFSRSVNFNYPRPGDTTKRAVIYQVQIGMYVQTVDDIVLTATGTDVTIEGVVTAIGGDAQGVAKPAIIWACAGAKDLQFNVEVAQWFEATPNSRLLQTTTTVPVPHGSINDMSDFWSGIEFLLSTGSFSYIWLKSDWVAMSRDFHPAQMMQWHAYAPAFITDFAHADQDNGDMSGFTRFFQKVGHELKHGGKAALHEVTKVGKKLVKEVAPEVLDMAVEQLGNYAGLTSTQQQAVKSLLDHHVKLKTGNGTMAGGSLAGGSLAGGSLTGSSMLNFQPRTSRKQLRLLTRQLPRGACAGRSELIQHRLVVERMLHSYASRMDSVKNQVSTNPSTTEWVIPATVDARLQFNRDPSIPLGGVCAGRVQKAPPVAEASSIARKQLNLSWKATRGVFVPALFFHEAPGHELSFESSGLYYFWEDAMVHQEYYGDGSWSKDARGTRLVGHKDARSTLEVILPKNYNLIAVNEAKSINGSADILITGDFTRPATGRSVEAACAAARVLQERGTKFFSPLAITGELIKPSDAQGWRVASMPPEFGYFKKRAVKSLIAGFSIPVIGNWDGADIPVKTVPELKKAINATATIRGGMCASRFDQLPATLWKNGKNPNFNFEHWLSELLVSNVAPGYIWHVSPGRYWIQDNPDKVYSEFVEAKGGICAGKATKEALPKSKAGPNPRPKPKGKPARPEQRYGEPLTLVDLRNLQVQISKELADLGKQLSKIVQALPVKDGGQAINTKNQPHIKFASLARDLAEVTQNENAKTLLKFLALHPPDISPDDLSMAMDSLRAKVEDGTYNQPLQTNPVQFEYEKGKETVGVELRESEVPASALLTLGKLDKAYQRRKKLLGN